MPMPAAIASSGERKRTGASRTQNLALVRRLQAEQDAHQRRLAGAVLAHHAVDLAPLGGEIDAVVGEEAAIALDDADGCDLGHETRPGSASYLALIGSAILIAPLTIWSRSAFTLAMASG